MSASSVFLFDLFCVCALSHISAQTTEYTYLDTTVSDYTKNIVYPAGSIFDFACPLPNGLFRDEENCAIFYHCLSDVPYKGYCRRGHGFDTDMMMCISVDKIPGCESQQVEEQTKSLESAEVAILEAVTPEDKPAVSILEAVEPEDKPPVSILEAMTPPEKDLGDEVEWIDWAEEIDPAESMGPERRM